MKANAIRVCFHLWCELTSTMNVTECEFNWNLSFTRNLFFRVHKLLQLDILPIFVLEGDPPPLKFETMMKRAYGLAYKSGSAPPKKMGRSHFKSKLREVGAQRNNQRRNFLSNAIRVSTVMESHGKICGHGKS